MEPALEHDHAATIIQAYYRRWRNRNVYVTVLDMLAADLGLDVEEEVFEMGAFARWYDGTDEVDWFGMWRLRYAEVPWARMVGHR